MKYKQGARAQHRELYSIFGNKGKESEKEYTHMRAHVYLYTHTCVYTHIHVCVYTHIYKT